MPPRPIEKSLLCIALWLIVIATAGCDASMPTSSAPPPPNSDARVEKLKTNFTVEEARELAQPAGNTAGLSVDVQGAQNTGVGNESFNGEIGAPKGLNTQRLFGQAASNDDERFERLEAAVQALRDDFDAVSPSINRLISIEREIQTLVDQLGVLVGNDTSAAIPADIPPVPAAMVEEDPNEFPQDPSQPQTPPMPITPPVPAPPVNAAPAAIPAPPTPAVAPAPQAQQAAPAPVAAPSSTAELSNLRIADNDKAARIVFEANENIPYTADVDSENILLVTFAKGTSKADLSSTKIKSSLVKSVDYTPQNAGGFILAIPLSKSSKIIKQGVLPPDANNPRYRIYIDLAR